MAAPDVKMFKFISISIPAMRRLLVHNLLPAKYSRDVDDARLGAKFKGLVFYEAQSGIFVCPSLPTILPDINHGSAVELKATSLFVATAETFIQQLHRVRDDKRCKDRRIAYETLKQLVSFRGKSFRGDEHTLGVVSVVSEAFLDCSDARRSSLLELLTAASDAIHTVVDDTGNGLIDDELAVHLEAIKQLLAKEHPDKEVISLSVKCRVEDKVTGRPMLIVLDDKS